MPEKSLGPDSLQHGKAGAFGFYTIADDVRRIRYVIDWNAGRPDTSSELRSGDAPVLNHSWPDTGRMLQSWQNPGLYPVRAKARDAQGRETGWSPPHSVAVIPWT